MYNTFFQAEEDLTGRVSKTPSINYEAEEQRELVQKLEKKVEKLKQALADKEDSTSKSSGSYFYSISFAPFFMSHACFPCLLDRLN